jgi:hypothetical protein
VSSFIELIPLSLENGASTCDHRGAVPAHALSPEYGRPTGPNPSLGNDLIQ